MAHTATNKLIIKDCYEKRKADFQAAKQAKQE